jgi:8-oxo-dGTP pyrophosphatase MutT (NUDIX family)
MTEMPKTQRFPKDAGSAAVLLNEAGEILIVKSPYKNYWTLPGGGIDEHETPHLEKW